MEEPSSLDALLSWAAALAGTATAIFAGLMWWMARQRMDVQPVLEMRRRGDGLLFCKLIITNNSPYPATITGICLRKPSSGAVDLADKLASYDVGGSIVSYSRPSARKALCSLSVLPGKSSSAELAFLLPEETGSAKWISILVHIAHSRTVMRHRIKAATMMLTDPSN